MLEITEDTWQTIKSVVPESVKRLVTPLLPRLNQFIKVRQDFKHPSHNTNSPNWLTYSGPSVLSREQVTFWNENGYLVLPKFFGQYRINEINALLDRLWAERQRPENPLVIDIALDASGGERKYFRDAPDAAREAPYKLIDTYLEHDLIRGMITDVRLCQILAELLEGDPMVCNTLNFERGSQQDYHFDTFYMPAPVENKMVASWIALEDVHPDAGPLQYYPGSHKIPPYRFSNGGLCPIGSEFSQFKLYIDKEIEKAGLKSSSFAAQAGDVLIWHSQLFHGGGAIHDARRTRKSVVTHYFRAMDFPSEAYTSIAPGRHYMNRPHHRVP